MNCVLLLLIAFAVADEDIYSPFKRTRVIQDRINRIYLSEKKFKSNIDGLDEQERRMQKELEDLYNDMKYAASPRDRTKMETEIENIQKRLQKLRLTRVRVLRKMRRTSDKITAPFRDNIVREAKVEDYVGLENQNSFVDEKMRTQKEVVKTSVKLAKKYASLAAEIAAVEAAEKAKASKVEAAKIEAVVSNKAQQEYSRVYKLIVKKINDKVSAGVARRQVKDVAEEAISDIVSQLVQKKALIPNVTPATVIAKRVVKAAKH